MLVCHFVINYPAVDYFFLTTLCRSFYIISHIEDYN